MKKALFLISALTICVAGCVTKATTGVTPQPIVTTVPSTVVGQPPILVTNIVPVTNYTYEVSPALASTTSNIQQNAAVVGGLVSAFYPPAAPAVPLAQDALTGILGLIALASGWYANKKNNDAKTQSDAAAAMASHIVTTQPGTIPTLIANTTSATGAVTPLTSAVQAHLTAQS